MEQDNVLICDRLEGREGVIGRITLNRLKALNALSLDMIHGMQKQLTAWAVDDSVKAVVICSASDKAFCAGGDVRSLYHAREQSECDLTDFFRHEYRLNQSIGCYPKPYICLLDGITMGGGVGISMHGSHPIATENFYFAMPETTIGFFPDVGGGHILSDCKHGVGNYLALTGTGLHCDEALAAGLLNYSIASERIDEFLETLLEMQWSGDPKQRVTDVIQNMSRRRDDSAWSQERHLIANFFDVRDVETIFSRLHQSDDDWALKTLSTLEKKSPTSLKVSFEQLRRAQGLSLSECLKMEFRMATRFMKNDDFFEGVRALLVDKDKKPTWSPSVLSDISDGLVQSYFEPLNDELTFITKNN